MPDLTNLRRVPETWQKALAVVAHPDDLEYGTASAIARWTNMGKQVMYLLATRGEAGIDSMEPESVGRIREIEQRNSAMIVGVDNVEFLDYPDGVIEYGLDLRRDIARAIRRHRPDVLITVNHHPTWGGEALNMADHRWVGLAALDAARDAGNRWVFPELLADGLEPWRDIQYIFTSGSPYLTHAIDVTDFMDKGVESLEAHRVYIDNLPDKANPDEFLRWIAAAVGERFGCEYAVGFEITRIN